MSYSNWERIWKLCKKSTPLTTRESKETLTCWRVSASSRWRTSWTMITRRVRQWSLRWRRISRTCRGKSRSWTERLWPAPNRSSIWKITSETTILKERTSSSDIWTTSWSSATKTLMVIDPRVCEESNPSVIPIQPTINKSLCRLASVALLHSSTRWSTNSTKTTNLLKKQTKLQRMRKKWANSSWETERFKTTATKLLIKLI